MTTNFIIHDNTPAHVYEDVTRGKGLELHRKGRAGYGTAAQKMDPKFLLTKQEVIDRLKTRKAAKQTNRDVIDQAGHPCKDQQQTNFCWINAPTYTLECLRIRQGQDSVILSPASAGAPIKNFRNEGGWGLEALQWIADRGLVPVEKWPANAISRTYYTKDNQDLALRYRCDEWVTLPDRQDVGDEAATLWLFSALIQFGEVAVGYNWWSHEVTAVDPDLDGQGNLILDFRNSWGMGWGDGGYATLTGTKMVYDDAVFPRSALPTP